MKDVLSVELYVSRDACSWMCLSKGRILVSVCKCCMFVSPVHPVASLSAVF